MNRYERYLAEREAAALSIPNNHLRQAEIDTGQDFPWYGRAFDYGNVSATDPFEVIDDEIPLTPLPAVAPPPIPQYRLRRVERSAVTFTFPARGRRWRPW